MVMGTREGATPMKARGRTFRDRCGPRRETIAGATLGLLLGAMLLVLSATGCGESRSAAVEVRSGDVTIAAAVEPADLRVGRNAIWLELRDAQGRPLDEAEVAVRVHMHAMGAMPAMGGPAAVSTLGDGRYRAAFELEMGSTWNVEIVARPAAGGIARAEGAITVGTPGLRLEGVGDSVGEVAGEDALPRSDAMASDERHPAEFKLPAGRLQRVGVRVAKVEREDLVTTIRAAGRVVAEETTLADVSLKVRGWVGDVEADAVGERVERGATLFYVYSPELYAAQEEFLQAVASQSRARSSSAPERSDYLVRAARRRLGLWDIAARDLARLEEAGEPIEYLPIRAPVSGYVVEKHVVEGSAFQPGQRLYRIAPLSQVWIEAEVYEHELALVAEGQTAQVTLPALPGRELEASVAYVYPTLDSRTRTARIRLELPNADLALRPDMYADVRVRAERGDRLVVPQSAVLHAGERDFVFRALGDGRFRPQAVTTGLYSGDRIEITGGLEAGDPIVVSGTFLIASESRLRAAMEQW